MKVSTNRPVFQASPMGRTRPASQAAKLVNIADSVRFSGAEPTAKDSAAEILAKPQGWGNKLFGSPLKNLGWAAAWGAAGGAAMFLLPIPPVSMGLMAIGALHLVASAWQFFTRKKDNAQTTPQEQSTSTTDTTKGGANA